MRITVMRSFWDRKSAMEPKVPNPQLLFCLQLEFATILNMSVEMGRIHFACFMRPRQPGLGWDNMQSPGPLCLGWWKPRL